MNAHTLDDFRQVQFLLACRYAKAIDALERAAPIDESLTRLRDDARRLIAEQCAAWFEVQS